jgi:F-type H+-transporting ATPase subunit a
MNPGIFTDTVLGRFGVLPVTSTMVTTLVTSALVLALAAGCALAIRLRPASRLAAAGRITTAFLGDLVTQAAGRSTPALESFAGTLFLFLAAATVVGALPGVAAPTSNLAATSALAAIVFLAVPFAGLRAAGPAYLKHYFRPNPILFPLHVISELSRTVALALRLFGNMMSGHLIVALIVALTGLFVPVPLMALDLLIGFLQSYIFTILACVYIGAALRVGGGE